MRLKRKFELKSGYFARFYIYKYRNTPLSQRGVSLTIKNIKNTYFLKPAAKVRKIFEMTKQKGDFVKSTLQNV